MVDTKRLANKLIRKYETRDPFRITNEMGYIVLDTPLSGIRGYYQYIRRCNIIYLGKGLSEYERAFVCAHELGHSLLHKDMNRIFMDTKTFMISGRYETEANHFAVDLLYSDEDLSEYINCSFDTISKALGISYSLAEYRMQTIKL